MSKTFGSFGEFGKFIGQRPERIKSERAEALGDIGESVSQLAQSKAGFYQDAVGPFQAWAPLAESTMVERVEKGFTPNDPLFRTGELAQSYTFAVDGSDSVSVGSPLDKAADMEFGVGGVVPARPVVGPSMYEEKDISAARIKRATNDALEKG